jgi:hypothetical protein
MRCSVGSANIMVVLIQMASFLRRHALAFTTVSTAARMHHHGGMSMKRQRTVRFMTHCVDSTNSTTQSKDDEIGRDKDNKSKRKREPPPPPLPDPSEFPDWAYEPRPFFRFEILHESTKSGARVGRIHTPHGIVDTPGFVAVATNAALKAVDFRDADEAGQQLVFANTYHLLLHPGSEIIRDAGGIHKFTNRNEPFITDSGGFQVRRILV